MTGKVEENPEKYMEMMEEQGESNLFSPENIIYVAEKCLKEVSEKLAKIPIGSLEEKKLMEEWIKKKEQEKTDSSTTKTTAEEKKDEKKENKKENKESDEVEDDEDTDEDTDDELEEDGPEFSEYCELMHKLMDPSVAAADEIMVPIDMSGAHKFLELNLTEEKKKEIAERKQQMKEAQKAAIEQYKLEMKEAAKEAKKKVEETGKKGEDDEKESDLEDEEEEESSDDDDSDDEDSDNLDIDGLMMEHGPKYTSQLILKAREYFLKEVVEKAKNMSEATEEDKKEKEKELKILPKNLTGEEYRTMLNNMMAYERALEEEEEDSLDSDEAAELMKEMDLAAEDGGDEPKAKKQKTN